MQKDRINAINAMKMQISTIFREDSRRRRKIDHHILESVERLKTEKIIDYWRTTESQSSANSFENGYVKAINDCVELLTRIKC